MITFNYDKKIDVDCWHRLIDLKEAHGIVFPISYNITDEDIKSAKDFVTRINYLIQEWGNMGNVDIKKGMYRIFKAEVPDIGYYVITAHYSMDKYPDYIAISKDRKNPIASVLHELNHFMFKHTFHNIPNIEEVKEIVEVINIDVFGIKDNGWPVYKEQRDYAIKIWEETQDINKVVASLKPF